MRHAAAALALIVLVSTPLGAQGRGRGRDGAQGIPPGHLPPAGSCRVWYEGRPPGQQPRPTSCREAERIASRDRYARVIYGSDGGRRSGGWSDRDDNGRYRDRAVSRRGGYGYWREAFDNGYRDGLEKGREDVRDRDAYDPVRHGRYRSADHGYDRRDGSKDEYRMNYREGFEVGYAEGYRRNGVLDRRSNSSIRVPWPFD